jgi:hypothetical protein
MQRNMVKFNAPKMVWNAHSDVKSILGLNTIAIAPARC